MLDVLVDLFLDFFFLVEPFTLILHGFAFLIAFPLVLHYVKKYPSDKSLKYIPAIVSFILMVYSVCSQTYGADLFLVDILSMLLIFIIFRFSTAMFIISIFFAAYFDIVSFIKNKRGVEKDEL